VHEPSVVKVGALVVALLAIDSWSGPPLAQSGPTFEVVSIKRSVSQEPGTRVTALPNGRFGMTSVPLGAVVLLAYELADFNQVEGLPDWTRTELYDIVAQAPAGVGIAFPGQGTALPGMVRAMLADRLKLVAHVEPRPTAMFALVVARADGRLGPNLTRSSIDCTNAPSGVAAAASPTPAAPQCGIRATIDSFSAQGIPLDRLIRLMIGPRSRRVVVDRTNLTGTFDVAMRFRPPDPPPGAATAGLPAPNPDLPSFEAAVEEQLGLRLQPIRELADMLVVDRIDRPTAD
jgi:uncharacterized protein (TIGR03435 family)